MYKLTTGGVIHPDGAFVPEDAGNRHWQEYLAWLGEGNEPLLADEPSLAEAKAEALAKVEAWAAQERARWRTPGMSETYVQKQRDVETYARLGEAVTPADVPYAARRAARKAGLVADQVDLVTGEQLAAVIAEYAAAMAFLRVKDLDIEDRREGAKEAIAAAGSVEEVEAVEAGLTEAGP